MTSDVVNDRQPFSIAAEDNGIGRRKSLEDSSAVLPHRDWIDGEKVPRTFQMLRRNPARELIDGAVTSAWIYIVWNGENLPQSRPSDNLLFMRMIEPWTLMCTNSSHLMRTALLSSTQRFAVPSTTYWQDSSETTITEWLYGRYVWLFVGLLLGNGPWKEFTWRLENDATVSKVPFSFIPENLLFPLAIVSNSRESR